MIYALERDGQSDLTFQGERLGIGAHAEWDQWTQVTIYHAHSGAYVLHTRGMTRASSDRGVREALLYPNANLLLAALQSDDEDVHFAQAAQKALVMAAAKDPDLAPNVAQDAA